MMVPREQAAEAEAKAEAIEVSSCIIQYISINSF